ncbi:MAG: hydroxymethylbilane synthase [Anaerolineae bacterium]|nr:hydroxymethylbilane synthase [Anaerolineae bacterium]
MTRQKLVVGTRGSALALWQTGHVVQGLRAVAPGLQVEIQTIKTLGDEVRDRALAQVGGKGLFVKEIEAALLAGEIDLAVHSLKDMPTQLPEALSLGAILERADPRDALVVAGEACDVDGLPAGARVGTSSLRRQAQLLAARPDLQVLDVRGNVDTRLRKLREGQYDGLILAAAGLARLGHSEAIGQVLPPERMLPAVGQGALCVEVRAADRTTQDLVAQLDHLPTRQATGAERAFLRRLEGGCQVPIGAYAQVSGDLLHLRGLVASLDGSRLLRDEIHGPADEAASLGAELADRLLAAGAAALLQEIERSQRP